MMASQLADRQPREIVDYLLADIATYRAVAVAFSGGVDSSVVAALAYRALGAASVAVTAQSPALATGELAGACDIAAHIGIRHHLVATGEIEDADYRRNPINRCYFCKTHLYHRIAETHPGTTILSGANLDDLGDWRPGLKAAAEHQVRHPLSSAGIPKALVRTLAEHLGLPNAAKPASPCLASRIPYGTPVTIELLCRVDRAEMSVRQLGYHDFRVRDHGNSATVELSAPDLRRLLTQSAEGIIDAVTAAGYSRCEISELPLRSGSLNDQVISGTAS